MEMQNKDIANVFKALCDENRVSIIKMLQEGEKCACELGKRLDMAQSKLSYHMKILCESGLVECWYEGKWTHYRLNARGGQNALEILENLINTTK